MTRDMFNAEDQLLYAELHINAHRGMTELYRVMFQLSENCLITLQILAVCPVVPGPHYRCRG